MEPTLLQIEISPLLSRSQCYNSGTLRTCKGSRRSASCLRIEYLGTNPIVLTRSHSFLWWLAPLKAKLNTTLCFNCIVPALANANQLKKSYINHHLELTMQDFDAKRFLSSINLHFVDKNGSYPVCFCNCGQICDKDSSTHALGDSAWLQVFAPHLRWVLGKTSQQR